jgi:hypothetical protein
MKAFILSLSLLLLMAGLWAQGPAPETPKAPPDPEAKAIAADLLATLSKIDKTLSGKIKSFAGSAEDEDALRGLLAAGLKSDPAVINAAFIDLEGILRYLEPEQFREYEGREVAVKDQMISRMESPGPVLSSPFKAAEGFTAFSLARPVYGAGGLIIGEVSLALHPVNLANAILKNNQVPDDYELCVMQKDGTIVLDQDQAEIGLNLFSDPLYDEYESLRQLGKRMIKEQTGEGEYSFYAAGTNVVSKKLASWSTISLHGTDWIVVLIRRV